MKLTARNRTFDACNIVQILRSKRLKGKPVLCLMTEALFVLMTIDYDVTLQLYLPMKSSTCAAKVVLYDSAKSCVPQTGSIWCTMRA